MPELIVMGSAASVPDADHDTIGLALRGSGWATLIECGGSPLYKLARLGIDLDLVESVIITHRHADHLYGLPILIQGLWLAGRTASLPIYGPEEVVALGAKLLDQFDLDRDDSFPVEWHSVPLREGRLLLETGEVRITSSPVSHGAVQTLGLRIESLVSGLAIAYSSDTTPSPAVVRLAHRVDLLLHEASGHHPVHTSAEEAAEIAREAGAAKLALVHYPVRGSDPELLLRAAAGFPGPVVLARDGDRFEF